MQINARYNNKASMIVLEGRMKTERKKLGSLTQYYYKVMIIDTNNILLVLCKELALVYVY